MPSEMRAVPAVMHDDVIVSKEVNGEKVPARRYSAGRVPDPAQQFFDHPGVVRPVDE